MNYFVLLLSTVGQWFVMATYLREALYTESGVLCRVKCTAAALLYASVGVAMAWLLRNS